MVGEVSDHVESSIAARSRMGCSCGRGAGGPPTAGRDRELQWPHVFYIEETRASDAATCCWR